MYEGPIRAPPCGSRWGPSLDRLLHYSVMPLFRLTLKPVAKLAATQARARLDRSANTPKS